MLKYRRITAADDEAIAGIVRANLKAMHLDVPGTVYFDPELDHLSAFYNSDTAKRCYYIALDENDNVIGGIGLAEFNGIDDCAEMQKLYLDDSAKGKGYSRELVALIEDRAVKAGYKYLYLETHSNLKVAMALYEKLGFKQIERPVSVVHGTMDHFYLKEL